MRVYINKIYQTIIIVLCKTGSTTVSEMLQDHNNWESVPLEKKITDPKNLLYSYIDKAQYSNYQIILLIRNPVDWIISGYRYMQYKVINTKKSDPIAKYRGYSSYPKNFREHLLAILNNNIKDEFWRIHCYWQPLEFYNDNFIIFRLEEFDKFKNYLDTHCNSDYKKHKIYHYNKNKDIEYPIIDKITAMLITVIIKKHKNIGKYNIKETIDNYKVRKFKNNE